MAAAPTKRRHQTVALVGALATLLGAAVGLGSCDRASEQSGGEVHASQAASSVDEAMYLVRRAHAIMDEVQEREATIVGDQPCGLVREAMRAATRDSAYSVAEREEIGSVATIVCDPGSKLRRRHDALHGLENYLKTGQGS